MEKLVNATIIKSLTWLLFFCLFAFTADTPRSQYTIPIAAYSVYVADIDLDGDMDIITGHNYDWQTHWGGISIMKNKGDGTFYLYDSLYFFGGQTILCGQLDNNLFLEIILKKWNTTQFIGILYNNDYSDTLFLNTNSNKGSDYLALGDVDNNELTDILFCSNNGQFWGIFYNYGYKNFSAPEYHYVTGYYPAGIACGDLNSDGREDVVISGQSTEVYYSLPNGFQKETLETNNMKNMDAIIDFDGDGDKDLLTAVGIPFVNVTSLIMYQNQNDTSLQVMPEVYFQPSSSRFFVTDFNNDGLPDIAFLSDYPDTVGTGITDTTGGINIVYNQGGFQLSEPQFVPLNNYGEGWRNFHCADLDGNGFNDIAIVRTIYIPLAGNLEILFNDGNGHFVNTPLVIDNPKHTANFGTMRCYPNPFYKTTTFEFEINQTAQVELSLYNLQGKFIQCLTHEKLKGDQYLIQWSGLDKAGQPCKPGAYIAYLKVNGKIRQTTKLIKY